jgi:hypothetical protein
MKIDNGRQWQFVLWSLEFLPIQNICSRNTVLNTECLASFCYHNDYLRQTNCVRKRLS